MAANPTTAAAINPITNSCAEADEIVLTIATLWWILFFAAVGLCIGSYLNVVVYRVPRGIPTTAPLWSFCPQCGLRIHWYDNLPVLSYVHLGGR